MANELDDAALAAPEEIWLPADTDADTWRILAKNPSLQKTVGYVRADTVEALRAELAKIAALEICSACDTGSKCGCPVAIARRALEAARHTEDDHSHSDSPYLSREIPN